MTLEEFAENYSARRELSGIPIQCSDGRDSWINWHSDHNGKIHIGAWVEQNDFALGRFQEVLSIEHCFGFFKATISRPDPSYSDEFMFTIKE